MGYPKFYIVIQPWCQGFTKEISEKISYNFFGLFDIYVFTLRGSEILHIAVYTLYIYAFVINAQ